MTPGSSPLRLGLIGVGYWGRTLLRVFGANPRLQVEAICDQDPRVLAGAATEAIRVVRVEDLLRDPNVDAIAVATPPSTHYELGRRVLEHGKHAWIEKPLALRTVEARELVALAARRSRVLFVDETFLYDPLVQKAKEWIDAGRLGRLYHLSFERLGMGRIRRDSSVWWNSAPHDLSLLRFLVPGDVDSLHLDGFAHLQAGIADMTAATLRLRNGVSAHIYLSWLSPLKVASLTVVGSQGALRYSGRFGQRSLSFYGYRVEEPHRAKGNVVGIEGFAAAEEIQGGEEEPLALAVEAFVDSVVNGSIPPSAGQYSSKVVELLEAAENGSVAPPQVS